MYIELEQNNAISEMKNELGLAISGTENKIMITYNITFLNQTTFTKDLVDFNNVLHIMFLFHIID
jgi:hypothetical protein